MKKTLEQMNDERLANFDYTDFLNIPLFKKDKQILCELLDLRSPTGKVLQWQSVKNMLTDYYFKIVNKTIRINGKQIRVSYIIDELENDE